MFAHLSFAFSVAFHTLSSSQQRIVEFDRSERVKDWQLIFFCMGVERREERKKSTMYLKLLYSQKGCLLFFITVRCSRVQMFFVGSFPYSNE